MRYVRLEPSTSLAATGGGSLSLTSCTGQLTRLTVTDSTSSMDASSTTTLGGSISLRTLEW